MNPEAFVPEDIPCFLAIAHAEGWIAEAWELDFLLNDFPVGCSVVRDDNGKAVAFATSIAHDRSGWVGNLIVADDYRGKGLGERLFLVCLKALHAAGVTTVWLTASSMGMGLYEKHGFKRLDTIVRWAGCGLAEGMQGKTLTFEKASSDSVLALDKLVWGDRRNRLLSVVMGRGESTGNAEGFATLQPCGDRFQLGPFIAMNENRASELLVSAQQAVVKGAFICLDAPTSNRSAFNLFKRNHFKIAGTNELMYLGSIPDYRPEFLYGMATMGSCG